MFGGTPQAESPEDHHGLGSSKVPHTSSVSSCLSPATFICVFTVRAGVSCHPRALPPATTAQAWEGRVQSAAAFPRHPDVTQLRSESPQWAYNHTPHQVLSSLLLFCCFLLLFVWYVLPVCAPLYPGSEAPMMGPSPSTDHSVHPMAASPLENGLSHRSLTRPP